MLQPPSALGTGSFRAPVSPQLSIGVRTQLARLAVTVAPSSFRVPVAGIGKDRDGTEDTQFVRVDDWLAWLLGAYLDSKCNASALFEALYTR